jgi:hypothetical protein
MAAYQIYRLELVYFNALRKRWQLFQEGPAEGSVDAPTSPDGLHRYHIRQILSTTRRLLERATASVACDFGVESPSHLPSEITFKTERDNSFLVSALRDQNVEWRRILDHYVENIETQELPAKSRQELREFFNSADLRTLTETGISLPRQAALDLYSSIVILGHWDLAGAWRRNWHSSASNESYSDLDQRLPRWKAPMYLGHIDFAHSPDCRPTRSESILGYPVTLTFTGRDLAASLSHRGDHGPVDFFRCCFDPKDAYPPAKAASELLLYRAYAYFTDHLQSVLANEQHVYYVAYPIITSGWRHFLHIYLRASNGKELNVLEPWDAWDRVHQYLTDNRFQNILADSIRQVSEFHYQSRVRSDLDTAYRKTANPDDYLEAAEVLTQNLPLLFPISTVITDGKQYGYEDEYLDAQFIGAKWQLLQNPTKPDESLSRLSTRSRTVFYKRLLPVEEELFTELRMRQMILYQELSISSSAKEAKSGEVRRRLLIMQKRAALYRDWLSAKTRSLALDPRLKKEQIDPKLLEGLESLVLECESTKRPSGADPVIELFKRIFGCTITIAVSEFLGVGPIQLLTHPQGPCYQIPESWVEAHQDLESFYKPIEYVSNDIASKFVKKAAQLKATAAEVIRGRYDDRGRDDVVSDPNEECSKLRDELKHSTLFGLTATSDPDKHPFFRNIELFYDPSASKEIADIYQRIKESAHSHAAKREVSEFAVSWKTELRHPQWVLDYRAPFLNRNAACISYELKEPYISLSNLISRMQGGTTADVLTINISRLREYGRLYICQHGKALEVSDDAGRQIMGAEIPWHELTLCQSDKKFNRILADMLCKGEKICWVLCFDSWRV